MKTGLRRAFWMGRVFGPRCRSDGTHVDDVRPTPLRRIGAKQRVLYSTSEILKILGSSIFPAEVRQSETSLGVR